MVDRFHSSHPIHESGNQRNELREIKCGNHVADLMNLGNVNQWLGVREGRWMHTIVTMTYPFECEVVLSQEAL